MPSLRAVDIQCCIHQKLIYGNLVFSEDNDGIESGKRFMNEELSKLWADTTAKWDDFGTVTELAYDGDDWLGSMRIRRL